MSRARITARPNAAHFIIPRPRRAPIAALTYGGRRYYCFQGGEKRSVCGIAGEFARFDRGTGRFAIAPTAAIHTGPILRFGGRESIAAIAAK